MTILEQAEKLDADVIVMGSHGREKLFDLVVGSVSAGVIGKSPVTVLVVPALLAGEYREPYPMKLLTRTSSLVRFRGRRPGAALPKGRGEEHSTEELVVHDAA